MKKIAIAFGAILIANTALGFWGDGYSLTGEYMRATTNVSRHANQIIAPGKGGSQRNNLHNVKRATAIARKKSREQKSKIRYTGRYMNSMNRASRELNNTPVAKPETFGQRVHRILSEKRAAKALINSN
jgi:hypothetical protein